MTLALDCAASEFYEDGKYNLSGEGKSFDAAGFADYLKGLTERFPIISIEDGLDESDWAGWKILTDKIGDKVQLVGDDLFVTNTKILKEGIDKKIANSILIKVNQIGTLTETLEAIEMATSRRLHRGDLAPFRRNRRFHHCRPRGRVPMPARSRPVRCAAPTASPSTTNCCVSKSNWAARLCTVVAASFAAKPEMVKRPQCEAERRS